MAGRKQTAVADPKPGTMPGTLNGDGRLLPESAVLFLKNTGWRLLGLVVLALVAGLLAALVTYDPADPALNAATDRLPANALGAPGAIVADLLMQTLGLGAFLLLLPLCLWAMKVLRLKWLPHFWLHLTLLPIALMLLAVAFSVPAPHPDFDVQAGYGGALGQVLYRSLATLTASFAIVPGWVTILVFVGLGLPAYVATFGLNRDEWAVLGRGVAGFLAFLWRLLRGLGAWVAAVPGLFRTARTDAGPEGMDGDMDEGAGPAPRRARKRKAAAPDAGGKSGGTAKVKPPKKTAAGKRAAAAAQITLDLGDVNGFRLPGLDLLTPPPPVSADAALSKDALENNARMLEGVLEDFGVQGDIRDVRPGPVVTLYELEPARGTKSARVIGLADDIARSMSAVSARVAVVAGRNAIGIELPNAQRETVYLHELLASRDFETTRARLPIILGKDIGGAPVVADLASMPHLLVAGTTGSGKSVGINTMILSLLYRHSPETLKLIMVDPKMLELSVYDGIPHLLTPVVTEPKKAVVALKWAVREMEERYRNMSKLGVRNLAAFNKRVREAQAGGEQLTRQVQTGFDKDSGQPIVEEQSFDFTPLPYIVVVIDEMADLMLVAGKDVEATVQRLAQMARAAGIHLIMATQRPSVDVITGTIKANFPTRISFQVTSKIDSRTILGEQGAEQLLGMGDMLFMAGGGRIARVHGAFVSDGEVESVVTHLSAQAAPDYLAEVTEEPEEGFDSPFIPGPSASGEDKDKSLYDQAVDIVIRDRRPTTSYIQRRLKIGYNKAASLIEEMEEQGVISAPNHKGQREVLVPDREEEL
ncbi:DNA translocase FtsK [Eilatimonas milleporae]|uniref:DNA translocase FtsK n=2 Tax=Eilatimonas milleporae TaxID=911205 RepID=A0A3M0BXQ8_9PROT|nr:DNA translocase FtsK 4TM domain-containing protein [Eilatimonas milleporae]RMB01822.1 DNA translocase FtsK [Eilatimonas milleporae]